MSQRGAPQTAFSAISRAFLEKKGKIIYNCFSPETCETALSKLTTNLQLLWPLGNGVSFTPLKRGTDWRLSSHVFGRFTSFFRPFFCIFVYYFVSALQQNAKEFQKFLLRFALAQTLCYEVWKCRAVRKKKRKKNINKK